MDSQMVELSVEVEVNIIDNPFYGREVDITTITPLPLPVAYWIEWAMQKNIDSYLEDAMPNSTNIVNFTVEVEVVKKPNGMMDATCQTVCPSIVKAHFEVEAMKQVAKEAQTVLP